MENNVTQENILNDTRSFLYCLIRDTIKNRGKNANGEIFFEILPYKTQIGLALPHIKENIQRVCEEMVKEGFMKPIKDDRYIINKFIITEKGYNELIELNRKLEENITEKELFDKLIEITKLLQNHNEILQSITEMKSAFEKRDKKMYRGKYEAFINWVANYTTIFATYIPHIPKFL